MDPIRRVWTLRGTHNSPGEAASQVAELRASGLRARTRLGRKQQLKVKPYTHTETRTFVEQQQAQMSDLADAKKRYKSMG